MELPWEGSRKHMSWELGPNSGERPGLAVGSVRLRRAVGCEKPQRWRAVSSR